MLLKTKGLILLFSIFLFHNSVSQENKRTEIESLDKYFKEMYSLDQHLINGPKYFNLYPGTLGHAFLGTNEFKTGKVKIKDNMHENIELKYDICNQKIILKYKNHFGGLEQIYLNTNEISEFYLSDKYFIESNVPEIGKKYFQLIDGGDIKIYIHWSKNLVRQTSNVNYYDYSQSKKKMFLSIGEQYYSLKNNSSFFKIFSKEKQNEIKKFMKRNDINLKNSSDKRLFDLIAFTGNLLNE